MTMVKITYEQFEGLPNGTLVMNDDRGKDNYNPNYMLIKNDKQCLYFDLNHTAIDDAIGSVGITCLEEESLFLAGNDNECTQWYNKMIDAQDRCIDEGVDFSTEADEALQELKLLYRS